jgi:hypothetical protein
MANQYEDDDFDDIEETQDANGPANLRKALKRAEKEKKELAEQLAAIQSDLRSRSVKEVLASKGVPDKVAKFIPSDVSTPEQVDAWLSENADVFGFAKPAESAEVSDETKANVASYQRINAATQNASAPTRDADMAAKLSSKALTKEDLDAMTGNVSGRFRG